MKVITVIKKFIECSSFMCKSIEENYDIKGETLLRARRINLVPVEGVLPSGCLFRFHGGGIYFEFENGSIDVDLGPNNRCDGFDSHRLYNFFMSQKRERVLVIPKLEFDNDFESLIKKGIVFNPNWYPNPHLYYIIEAFRHRVFSAEDPS